MIYRGARRPQRQSAVLARVSAPVLGMNTKDSLQGMDSRYGLSIQNFIATSQGLSVRQGYRTWATGLPTSVTSLLPYHGKNPLTSKLFAVSGTAIYDCTNAGTVGAPVVSGLNSSAPYWQFAVQSTSTGTNSYMFAVNGLDAPRMYDGTSWTTCTQVATPAAPGQFKTTDNAGNPVNINNLVDVVLHQQRLWFVAVNSTKAYYCDIASSGGTLYPFDFGAFFPTGGNLQKLAVWTTNIDGTAGNQTVLVALSDHGDVAIYAGNNPAVAGSFNLSGQFKIGSPIGRRCATAFESDLLILTQDGLYPMSKYMADGRANEADALTYKIQPTISDVVTAYASTPGFETIVYPGNDVMLLNVPQSAQANNFQFCFNTQTAGWTQFTGWPAQCWGLYNNQLYFGGTNSVNLAFIGYQDGATIGGAGGNNVVGTAMSAFTTLDDQVGTPGLKKVEQIRPYFATGQANPAISVGINTDFNLTPIVGSATLTPATGAVWDQAKWDDPSATWVGSLTTYNQWQSVASWPANWFAVVISVSATTDTLWAATDYMVKPGGIFG